MGYFSNGTEADHYTSEFCCRCVNWRDLGDGRGRGCPIFDLHMLWNREACNGKRSKKGSAKHAMYEALERFIPTSKDGISNERCVMFQEGDSDDMPDPAEERRKLSEWNALYGARP